MMKIFCSLLLMLMMLAIGNISAQVTSIEVTAEDIELQFVIDPTEQWRVVDIASIEYSMEPVRTHNPKGRLGIQTWDFALQADEPELGKCIVKFNLLSLPAPNFRSYIIQVRVRDEMHIANWTISDGVKILGKTGKPVHK